MVAMSGYDKAGFWSTLRATNEEKLGLGVVGVSQVIHSGMDSTSDARHLC